jgi:signal transduction histidine kinase
MRAAVLAAEKRGVLENPHMPVMMMGSAAQHVPSGRLKRSAPSVTGRDESRMLDAEQARSAPATLQRSLVDMAAEDAVLCLVEMLDLTWATLLLLDDPARPRGGYVRHRATYLPQGASYDRQPHPAPEPPLWPAALASQEPVEGDAGLEPETSPRARLLGVRSYLAVSLLPSDGSAPLGVLFLNRDRADPFDERQKTIARRLAIRVADIIARSRRESLWQMRAEGERQEAEHAHALLVREQAARAVAESAQERLGFLAEVSSALAASLDYHETLQQVARLAVPVLADWCTVNIVEEDGNARRLAVAHVDPTKEALVQQLVDLFPIDPEGTSGPAHVLRTGQARIVPEVTAADVARAISDPEHRQFIDQLGVQSVMYVPLVARGHIIGVMSFIASVSRRHYGAADLALAEALGERCGMAIDNARLYQAAQEAIAARERFIAVASHELRTPVTNISGFAQLLKHNVRQGGLERERAEHYVDRLLAATQKLTTLTMELLDVSRLRSGKTTVQLQSFDLAARLRDITARFAAEDGAKHHLIAQLPATPLPIVADVSQIEQVVTNLLENAIKYSPEGGDIHVSLTEQDDGVLLQVRDEGIGLPEGAAAAVFEPFDRGSNAERLVLPGLGLGLYICRTIAEAHGGRIWAESPGEGQGTTMSLWLPNEPKGEPA